MDLDFGKLDPNGSEPVYMQIVRRFKLIMLRGGLNDGDEAPSRRMLAARLGVNPNTVQKAFAELEREGLIETPPNAKSYIRANDEILARLRNEFLTGEITSLINMAKEAGLSYKQLIDLISAGWDNIVSVK